MVSSSFWGLLASLAHGSITLVSASIITIMWPSPERAYVSTFYENTSHKIQDHHKSRMNSSQDPYPNFIYRDIFSKCHSHSFWGSGHGQIS